MTQKLPSPLVSVVIPCFNQANYLGEAVQSVISQTYAHWECVIVNDGSPDDTPAVARDLIARHPDRSIKLVDKKNGGLVDARNAGVRASSGEFILFLDADDKIHPEFLKGTVQILVEKQHVGFVYTAVQHFGARTDVWGGGPFSAERLLRENQMACTTLFRRQMFDEVGGLKSEMKEGFEDWEFWISGLEKGWHGHYLERPYFFYRKHRAPSMLESICTDHARVSYLKAKIVSLHPSLYSPGDREWAFNTLGRGNPFTESSSDTVVRRGALPIVSAPSRNRSHCVDVARPSDRAAGIAAVVDVKRSLNRVIIAHTDFRFSPAGVNSGAEMATIYLASSLAAEGIEVSVFGLFEKPVEHYLGAEYRGFQDYEELCAALASLTERVGLLIAHSVNALSHSAGNPNIAFRTLWIQNPPISFLASVPEINRCADAVIHVSRFQIEAGRAVGIERPVILLYNGFSEAVFQPADGYDPRRIVCAGALVPQKGVHLLVQSFPAVRAAIPGAKLVVCGSPGMWGEKAYLDTEAISRAIPGIVFTGAVPQKQLARLFSNSALGVMPTIKELWQDPFPLTSVEMQACGIPVLVSAAGGLPESIIEGETGLVLDSDQPEAWASGIIDILRDRERLGAMRAACAKHARNRFRWRDLAIGFLADVERLRNGSASANRRPSAQIPATEAVQSNLGSIAFLSTWNQRCGISTHTAFITPILRRVLDEEGFQATPILILGEEGQSLTAQDGENVFRCWRRNSRDFRKALQVVEREGITHLHVQFQDGLFAGSDLIGFLTACKDRGVRIFLTLHSSEANLDFCAALVNLAHRAFTHLDQSAIRYIAHGANPERIRVVPHGITSDLVLPDIAEAKATQGIPGDLRIVSSFGFVEPHKGIHGIIEAFPQVLNRHNAALLIAGGGHPHNPESIEYMRKCRQMAEHLGISQRVRFVEGFLPDKVVTSYLAASDAIVMNYALMRNEISGAAAFALAHRRPLITTPVPAFSRLTRCTLQLSHGMGMGDAINLILGSPSLAAHLVTETERHIAENSYRILVTILVDEYRRSRDTAQRPGVVCPPEVSGGSVQESVPQNRQAGLVGAHSPVPRRIGIDLRTLADSDSMARGIGHYAVHHLDALLKAGSGHRFAIIHADGERMPTWGHRFAEHDVDWIRDVDYRPHSLDLIHTPDPMGLQNKYDSPFAFFREPRMTAIFHDLIPFHFYRESMGILWPSYLARLEQMRRSGVMLLCNSEFTREDLIRSITWEAERCRTIFAGLNQSVHREALHSKPEETLRRYGVRDDFVLFVGTMDPHKNFGSVLNAVIEASRAHPLQLLVTGRMNASSRAWHDKLREMGLLGQVVFTDFLPRAELELLYSRATAMVLLSRYEGFGFPVLEAMAAGCPVICSNTTSLPEVAGEAALLHDPEDIIGVARSLVRLLRDRDFASRLREAGRKRASRFTWEETARKTLEVWDEMLARPGRAVSTCPDKPATAVWMAPIFDPSGYASEARAFLLHLERHGESVAARSIGRHSEGFREMTAEVDRAELERLLDRSFAPHPVGVLHAPAYSFDRASWIGYHVGRTTFETDGLPPDWVERCNRMEEIWVPSMFNVETFRKAGVSVPILRLPEGVDVRRFRPGLPPLLAPSPDGGITFLSVFEWSHRKGWDVLLRAWAQAFGAKDNARLVLRTYPINSVEGETSAWIESRIDEFLDSIGSSRADCAPILVLAEQVPEPQMPNLYNSADVYIAPSRGEGWGRPHMEAMACGLPVIATRWGGNLDFMTEDNSWLLDIESLVQIDTREEFHFYRGQNWAEPSVAHLKRLMRLSASSSELRQLLGKRARKDMEEKWDWGIIAPLAALRLKEILAGVPAEQSRLHGNVSSDHIGLRDCRSVKNEIPSVCVPAGGVFRIRWEGSQLVHHSLALVNRELCLALSGTDHELSLIPYEPDQFGVEADSRFRKIADLTGAPLSGPCDVHIRHQWPPCFTPPQEGHWVMIQPWEYGRIPRDWVTPISTLVDEIWVPSRHVFRSFVSSGIPSDRVRVVPNGVNTSLFSPDAKPYSLPTSRKFKFLFVGGTIWRKGVDILLEAYRDAFSKKDDVVLVIKDFGQNSFYRGQGAGEAIRAIQSDSDAPEILYMTDMLAESDMPGLFTACDCLVHPYRGEGFGLPVLEAMACAVPVIVTAGGATDDFCTAETAYLVQSRRKSFVSKDIDFVGGSGWVLEPETRSLGELMRQVYENPDEADEKSARALAQVRTDYTWENIGRQVLNRIRSILSKPIRRVQASYLKAV